MYPLLSGDRWELHLFFLGKKVLGGWRGWRMAFVLLAGKEKLSRCVKTRLVDNACKRTQCLFLIWDKSGKWVPANNWYSRRCYPSLRQDFFFLLLSDCQAPTYRSSKSLTIHSLERFRKQWSAYNTTQHKRRECKWGRKGELEEEINDSNHG